ncbi:MAG: DUF1624 domain-containing protein [Sandaracinaceae bacterium]|nr:DUF1624 domain-containing protein [Sandaracinaceae bacterium]
MTGASRSIEQGPPARVGGKGARWLALDLLRFVAVLLMVQGHVFTSLLDPSYESQRWLRHHNFVHGYTAPMFLFASGLAFGYTTFRAWKANTTWGDGLAKRFRRYGWLLVIGYVLHMPALALTRLVHLDAGTVRTWLQVDVLQHIGVSLALLQLLALAVRREKVFVGIVGALFTAVVLGAPLVWAADVSFLPSPIASYLNADTGSLFPLFPWAGFTYAGILVAYAARSAKRPSHDLAWPLLALTVTLFVVPIALNRTGLQPYGAHDFWKTDPYYFFFRLANVLAVLTAWCFVEKLADARSWLDEGTKDAKTRMGELLSLVRIVGAESLLIYVVHLVFLHGSVLSSGLEHATGRSLTFGQASFVAATLFFAMVALAWTWHEWKKGTWRFRVLQWSAISGFAYLMLTSQ